MSNRDSLAMQARVLGLDPTTIANDSVLEERVLYLQRTAGAATGALATATLTSNATAPANNATVTIGDIVYTYKTTLTGATHEVLIGASASIALDNIKSAINGTAGAGTTYGASTPAHPEVTAGTKTATTLVIDSIYHAAGNRIVTTDTDATLSWGAGTMASGLPKVVAAVDVQASRVPRGSAV